MSTYYVIDSVTHALRPEKIRQSSPPKPLISTCLVSVTCTEYILYVYTSGRQTGRAAAGNWLGAAARAHVLRDEQLAALTPQRWKVRGGISVQGLVCVFVTAKLSPPTPPPVPHPRGQRGFIDPFPKSYQECESIP